MQNYYKSGTFNVICDVCGKKTKSDQVQKRWDGLIVCKEDFETRHPQDFLRVRADRSPPPFVRDEPVDTFITFCWLGSTYPVAGVAVAGCAVCGDGSDTAIAGQAVAGIAVCGNSHHKITFTPTGL